MASLLPQRQPPRPRVLNRALANSITDRYPNAATLQDAEPALAGVIRRTAQSGARHIANIPPLELSAPGVVFTDWRPASGSWALARPRRRGGRARLVALGALVTEPSRARLRSGW